MQHNPLIHYTPNCLGSFYFPEVFNPVDSPWAQALGVAKEQSSDCSRFINELQLLIISKKILITVK